LIGWGRGRFAGWADRWFIGWPVDRLPRRPNHQRIGWLDGRLIGCRPVHRFPGWPGRRLFGWFARWLISWLVDLERYNFMDDDEKNYPDQRACQRVEKEIFQCISLASWQHQLDNGANDISALLNDT